MTAYDDRELSAHEGEPVECYEFVGTFNSYRYTSGDLPVLVNGFVFTPLPITRSEAKAGIQGDDGLNLDIELPLTAPLVRDYAFQVTPPSLTLTIYRVHRGTDFATDYAVYWSGQVAGFSITNDVARLRVPSVFSQILAGSIPSVFYQAPCNHVLFDGGCKVPRPANSVSTGVVAVNETVIQINSAGSFADGWFRGGEVVAVDTGERRMIVEHEGLQVTVNYPFARLIPGMLIEVVAGCNHAFDGDCKLKFNNQINFGGHPFIPSVNVFEEGM